MRWKFVSLLLVVCHLPSLLSFQEPQAHLNLPMRRDEVIIIIILNQNHLCLTNQITWRLVIAVVSF